jgi:ketosteroid isomerase-like protein
MVSAQDNAAVIRRGYELFNSGNMEGLQGIFLEDAVWHVGGRNQLSGEKRGRDACFQYFGQIGELTNGTFRAEMHDVVAGAEHAVGIHTSTGEREGRRLNEHTVLVFHLRDGKVAEAWEHYEDSRRVDDFFGS